MKFSILRDKFKSRFNIRIVSGVLIFTLVGTGVSAYEVSAAKNAGGVTAAAQQEEDEAKVREDDGAAAVHGSGSDAADDADAANAAGSAADADAADGTADAGDAADASDVETALGKALNADRNAPEKEIGKEETVYVIADQTGAAEKVMISEHLINADGEDTIKDRSELTDIENVKGDETFTQSGNQLVWQADGNDIYYQGSSQKELPVTQKITYYLDGKEIAPEELAGKSGTVRIRFDYVNHTEESVWIDGKEERVHVPFAAVSGLILDDRFRNIQVKNGRAITDGNRNVVIGYALPGLKESLQIEDGDFEGGLTIPEYFEVTAEVTDFSMDMTMTVVMNAAGLLDAEGNGDLSSVDEMLGTLTDAAGQLTDGSAELAEGMDTLQEKLGDFSAGVNSMKTGLDAYTQGASQLADGAGQLKTGVDTLAGNIPALIDGVGQLKAGSANAVNGANALRDGAGNLKAGSAQVRDGVSQVVGMVSNMGTQIEGSKAVFQQAVLQQAGVPYGSKDEVGNQIAALEGQRDALAAAITGALGAGQTVITLPDGSTQNVADLMIQLGQINAGLESLQRLYGTLEGGELALGQVQSALAGADTQAQLEQLERGAAQVADGAAALADGAAALADGLGTLDAGLGSLNEKVGALSAGVSQLTDGANRLAGGSAELASKNSELMDGISQLSNGTSALVNGVSELDDGAHTLADGIVTFNEEGIQKILDSYNGDLAPLMDRFQAVMDAGEAYQSYGGIADGVGGSVRFVYRTAGISSKS